MKNNRVKLLKQVKEESERFRALKAEKSKEILQLKEQVRIKCYHETRDLDVDK